MMDCLRRQSRSTWLQKKAASSSSLSRRVSCISVAYVRDQRGRTVCNGIRPHFGGSAALDSQTACLLQVELAVREPRVCSITPWRSCSIVVELLLHDAQQRVHIKGFRECSLKE